MNKKISATIFAILMLIGLYIMNSKTTAPTEYPLAKNTPSFADIKDETNYIDGIDDNKDGSADNSNGDGWIKEGPIYETHPYYYDGTFRGLTKQIPSIADLGVKTIYLMPIWEHRNKNPQYLHIYLIKDYYKIDSAYGTKEDLKELVETVHKYDMKIIFDMVTAALPKENIAYNWTLRIPLADLEKKAKEQGLTLKYTADDNGNRIIYSGWWPAYILNSEVAGIVEGQDVALLTYPAPLYGPAINRTDPNAIEYFTNVAEYYVKEFNVDGWRLDSTYDAWNPKIISGDHSIINMTKSMRAAVKEIKPDAIFLAEQASYNLDETTDASYEPKELREAIADRLAKGKMTSQELVQMLNSERIGYNRTRAYFLETHDSRRLQEDYPKQSKPLLVLSSTIPRIPMIQAGQEIGSKNHWFYPLPSDPKVNWAGGDKELRNYYKKAFGIRNSSNALKYGDIKNVWKSGDNIYAYSRNYENETVVVAMNFRGKTATSVLSLPFKSSTVLQDELSGESFNISNPDNFKINISAYGSRILTLKKQ